MKSWNILYHSSVPLHFIIIVLSRHIIWIWTHLKNYSLHFVSLLWIMILCAVWGWSWTRGTAHPVQCHLDARNPQVSELCLPSVVIKYECVLYFCIYSVLALYASMYILCFQSHLQPQDQLSIIPVHPSICMKQPNNCWRDFNKTLYWIILHINCWVILSFI